MGAEQLIFVQIIGGYPPFFDGGMVVNTRDECPACAALQVDILTRTIGEQFPPYITYNLGNSDADQVYIWIARQHH
jgi:hypothetical protein